MTLFINDLRPAARYSLLASHHKAENLFVFHRVHTRCMDGEHTRTYIPSVPIEGETHRSRSSNTRRTHLLHERVVVCGGAQLDRDAVHLQQLVALGGVVRSVRKPARPVEGVDGRLHLGVVGDLQVHLVFRFRDLILRSLSQILCRLVSRDIVYHFAFCFDGVFIYL